VAPVIQVGAVVPVAPRLLDVEGAANYLSVSPWTIRDLIANGTLARVRVPLPRGGELRRVLLDREDLDRLVHAWRDGAREPEEREIR
jgi:excisionase family DNA binding protein